MKPTFIDLHKLRQILEEHPTLCGEGLGKPNGLPPYDGLIDLAGVCEAMKWLEKNASKTKTIRRKASSYGLKHIMEEKTGHYVSNGEFILAALLMGFRPDDKSELNPFFNMTLIE